MGGTKKRHGWIMNLTAAEESRVLARWPQTPAQRLQSYNFQGAGQFVTRKVASLRPVAVVIGSRRSW
jgi:hypothetical protein